MSLLTRSAALLALVAPLGACNEVMERLEAYAEERIDQRIDEELEERLGSGAANDTTGGGTTTDDGPVDDEGPVNDEGPVDDDGTADQGWDDTGVGDLEDPFLAEVTFLNEGPGPIVWIDVETCDGFPRAPIVDQHPLHVGAARSVLMEQGCYRLTVGYQDPVDPDIVDAFIDEIHVGAGQQYLFPL